MRYILQTTKHIFYIIVLFTINYNIHAQNVNIPDAGFKAALLAAQTGYNIAGDSTGNGIKVDINNDGIIQVSEALKVYTLYLSNWYTVSSLSGIESFKNLRSLSCTSNGITSLPVSGLVNLRNLNCDRNQLTFLNTSGCSNLQVLYCNANPLASININGCNNLRVLKCSGWKDLSIVGALRTLNLSGLSNLRTLDCSGNQITSLDAGGLSYLDTISCYNNGISNLNITGCTNLKILLCVRNNLSTLNASGLTNLTDIESDNNHLTSLNANGCINLQTLECNYNELTSLDVRGCSNLYSLICYGNSLTSLDISQCHNLNTLAGEYNLLTSLDASACRNLQELYCSYNKLTYLNIGGLTHLSRLGLASNPLSTIYMKNGLNDTYNIGNNYSFPDFAGMNNHSCFICADDSDLRALKQVLGSSASNIIYSYFCNSTINESHYTMIGNSKFDGNNNGCTITDQVFPYLKVKLKNATDSGYAIADALGNFAIVADGGTYIVTPTFYNNYFNSSPASNTVTVPEDSLPQAFCITRNGIHHDISVNIIPVRAARPGFSDTKYKIVLTNKGTQTENGNIAFNYDETKQDYLNASQTPGSISSGQLIFTFDSLQLFTTLEITITMRTNAPTDNPPVNAGDMLLLSVNTSLTDNTDEYALDNTQQIHQIVLGSIDPNDKTCLEGTIISPAFIGDYVNYLIRFENTGSANATNILVTDYIDLSKFDISTLELTSVSHSCKTIISNNNKVQFVFDNINLPFTAPDKYGYVAFKIKTKNNLIIGDSLKNKADIYFDYNIPVRTNTAVSKISIVTGITNHQQKNAYVNVFPNPNNGNFTVDFSSKGDFPITVTLFDIIGKVVYQESLQHADRSFVQISDAVFPSGLYNIQISSDKDIWNKKVMVTK